MKKYLARFLVCVVALCAFAAPSRAVAIGRYPGLDELIKQADVVAIVRIEDASVNSLPNGWTPRRCYVYQTLKGDLKTDKNDRTQIMFNEFIGVKSNFGGEGLGPNSTHLVFLMSNGVVLSYQGADMPLSPLGNEAKPAGKTLKAQVQTLLRSYKEYRARQLEKEDAILDEALKELDG